MFSRTVRFVLSVLAPIALLAAPLSVARAQLTLIEPPDLSNSTASPSSIGALGLGDNTITGGVSATMFGLSAIGDPVDAVSFTVPTGMAVTLVDLTITGFANSSGILGQRPNVYFVSPQSFVQCSTSGTTPAPIPTPTAFFGAGTYTIAVLSGLNAADHPNGSTRIVSYILRLRTQPLLAYNEAAGAAALDLGSATPATSVGTLSVLGTGENFIGGTIDTIKVNAAPATGDQSDFFSFTVPSGSVATSITIRMTDQGSTINCLDPRLVDASNTSFVRLVNNAAPLFPIIGGVLAPGTYELRVFSSTLDACGSSGTQISRFSYAITITAAAETTFGACCNRWTGHCLTMFPIACAAMGMTHNGPSTTCTPMSCTPCPADFNGSSTLNVADIFDFLTAWFAGC